MSYEYLMLKFSDLSLKEGWKLLIKLLSGFLFDRVMYFFLVKKFFGVVNFIILGMKDKFGWFMYMLFYCVVILILVVLMYDGNGMFILFGFGFIFLYLKGYFFRIFILYFFIYSVVVFGLGMFGNFLF